MRISRARAYIRARALDGLSLAEVAAEAGVSPFYFSRLYAALTGETVFGYVTRLRLRHAAGRLVAEPHLPVTEVALEVGIRRRPRSTGSSAPCWAFRPPVFALRLPPSVGTC